MASRRHGHGRAVRPRGIRNRAVPRVRQRAQHVGRTRLHCHDGPVVDAQCVLERPRRDRVEARADVHGDVRVGDVAEGVEGVLQHRAVGRRLRGGGDGEEGHAGQGAAVAGDDGVARVGGGGVGGGVLGLHAEGGVGLDEAVEGGRDGGFVDGQVDLRGAVAAVIVGGGDGDEDDVGAVGRGGPVDGEEDPLIGVVGGCGEGARGGRCGEPADAGSIDGVREGAGATGVDVDVAGSRAVWVHWGKDQGVIREGDVVIRIAGDGAVAGFDGDAHVAGQGRLHGLDVGDGRKGVTFGLLPD